MSNDIFYTENHAVCEIMWENVVELNSPQTTVYGAWALHAG